VSTGEAPAPTASTPAFAANGDAMGTQDKDTGDANAAASDAKSAPPAADGAYDPCPHVEPCRVMPLGDSITAGFGSTKNGSYRVELFRKAHQAGQNLTFVGTMRGGPATVDGVPFPTANEGHGGYTIDNSARTRGISPLVVDAMKRFRPHVVTLMIGTNDISNYLDLPHAPARLGALIDTIVATDPKVLLVVAKIIPIALGNVDPKVVAYNAGIPKVVAARAAAGAHVLLVDMHGAFTKNPRYPKEYMFDYVHPKDPGYAVMGDVWYDALSHYLH
jgi:lysophospholipase L1-like esterase